MIVAAAFVLRHFARFRTSTPALKYFASGEMPSSRKFVSPSCGGEIGATRCESAGP